MCNGFFPICFPITFIRLYTFFLALCSTVTVLSFAWCFLVLLGVLYAGVGISSDFQNEIFYLLHVHIGVSNICFAHTHVVGMALSQCT